MGEETLRYLIDAGAKSIALINRSYDKAVDASSRLGGRAYPWEELDREMMQADLVVSTTGSQEPIVISSVFVESCRSENVEPS